MADSTAEDTAVDTLVAGVDSSTAVMDISSLADSTAEDTEVDTLVAGVESSTAVTDISSPTGSTAERNVCAASGDTEVAGSNPDCPGTSEADSTMTNLTGNIWVANSKIRDSLEDNRTGDTLVVADDKTRDTLEKSEEEEDNSLNWKHSRKVASMVDRDRRYTSTLLMEDNMANSNRPSS